MALLAPAAGGSAMAAIDVWRYQLVAWELDLSYYRSDGLIGQRERIAERILSDPRAVTKRLGRRLRSYGAWVRRASQELGAKTAVAPLLCGSAPPSGVGTHAWETPAARPTTLDVPLLPGCTHTCTMLPETASSRDWDSIRVAMNGPAQYSSTGSLVEKCAVIIRMACSLAVEVPGIVRERYVAHMAEIRAQEEAEQAAERAAAEAEAKAHPNLRHPPTLAPAYRDQAITTQAREYVYERLPLRVATGLASGGAIAGLASMSIAGTRKLNSLGPVRFLGGLTALGGIVGGLVDLTTRAGYEDAFLESGEAPPRTTPWVIKPNKTFIMLAGTFGGYPASATFFNAYFSGATAARAERSASPLQTFPWVQLQLDQAELERRHHELVVTQAWTRDDDAAVTDEIASARERRQRTTLEENTAVWSEEELGQFLTNIGFLQLVVVLTSFSTFGFHAFASLRMHPFFAWAFASPK